MPFIHAKLLAADEDPRLLEALHAAFVRLAAEHLGKAKQVTSVLIERVDPGGWSIGGAAVSNAAHATISTTAGSNTAAEKADFVAQTHATLRDLLGERLPVATYVVVDEIDAESWGYGGLTVAARRQASPTA